ncbi:16S rRNA (adenine(1518)-N(6)/adenine(1519)-N(6))-dimethyltransferase RsmA [bacterium]|nr:16S rRNA (adenine(1518)-N(6)/adenine(1519)-N(6))-dimethyltransferase RsmA [bacterium]
MASFFCVVKTQQKRFGLRIVGRHYAKIGLNILCQFFTLSGALRSFNDIKFYTVAAPSLPKKRLSQNFLIDKNIVKKIVTSSGIHAGDTVVEIGCGQGALTEMLIEKASRLYGIEYDTQLIPTLNEKFGSKETFRLIQDNVLEFDWDRIDAPNFKVIGNLPYHITSPIIFKIIDKRDHIETFTMMIQKEVAQRIVAAPSSKVYGILSVFCQFHADCKKLFDVPPTAFFPRPKVYSSIVQMKFRPFVVEVSNYEIFRTVVRQSFNQRRKMMRNSLAELIQNKAIHFDFERRPETLSVREFVELSNTIAS